MNGLPYYKAYPRDFIEGTIGLDFEAKAAYRLVLDLIYMQGGNLPDDARYVSGLLGCSVKKWKSLRDKLLSLGKIVVRDGYLGNYRADKELETLGKLQDKQRENRSRPNKNKALQSPPTDHTELEPYTDTNVSDASDADASAMDPAKIVFDSGVKMLTAAGKSPGAARAMIGKWRKEHQDEAIIVALGKAQRAGAVDPIPYITAALAKAGSPQSWAAERDQRQKELVDAWLV